MATPLHMTILVPAKGFSLLNNPETGKKKEDGETSTVTTWSISCSEQSHSKNLGTELNVQETNDKYHFQQFVTYSLVTIIPENREKKIKMATAHALTEMIERDYTVIEKELEGNNGTAAQLKASQHILQQFYNLQDQIEEMNDFVIENRKDVLSDRQAFTGFWGDGIEELLYHLHEGIRCETRELLQTSWREAGSVEKSPSGHVQTAFPEEVAFIVDEQLAAAREELSEKYLIDVLSACNVEISCVVGSILLEMGRGKGSSMQHCAMINDANRLTKLLEKRNDVHFSTVEYDEARGIALRELSELRLQAANGLCECIIEKADLNIIGNAFWQSDEIGVVVAHATSNLVDSMQEVKGFLKSDYIFLKILKKLFHLVLQAYTQAFFRNTMEHGVDDAAEVSRKLNQDYQHLLSFFNGRLFARYLGTNGFLSEDEMQEKLRILQSLARLADPQVTFQDLVKDARFLLANSTDFAEQGALAVLHLAGLRKQRHSGDEKAEWSKVIRRAEQKLNKSHETTKENAYKILKLPDLSSSKYVQSLKVTEIALKETRLDPVGGNTFKKTEVPPRRRNKGAKECPWIPNVYNPHAPME